MAKSKVNKTTKLTVDNRATPINKHLRQALPAIWNLNDQEVSYLDKYFMLVRTKRDLREQHEDTHQLWSTFINGGTSYAVIFQGLAGWEDLQDGDKLMASFRLQTASRIAVVLVRKYEKSLDK